MMRRCDGTDPNLTREIPEAEYDPVQMILAPWQSTAKPKTAVIQCQCAASFDDVKQRTIWPHKPVTPGSLPGLGG